MKIEDIKLENSKKYMSTDKVYLIETNDIRVMLLIEHDKHFKNSKNFNVEETKQSISDIINQNKISINDYNTVIVGVEYLEKVFYMLKRLKIDKVKICVSNNKPIIVKFISDFGETIFIIAPRIDGDDCE